MNRFLKGMGFFAALLGVSVLSAVAVIAFLLRQEDVRVPELVGKDIVTALDIAGRQGLQLKVDGREPSPTVPRDGILAQTPAPGAGIKKGRTLRVVVSRGPAEALLPRLIGEPYYAAEIQLRQTGFPEPVVARVWSDRIERDAVISQDPPPGTPCDANGPVELIVSLGRKVPLYVTPKLTGKRLDEAVRIVDRMGFPYQVITRPTDTAAPSGERIVTGQKPPAGYPLPEDGSIELVAGK